MSKSDQDYEKMKAKIKHELEPFLNIILSKSDEFLMEFGDEYKNYLKKCDTSLGILISLAAEWDAKVLPTSIKEQVFHLYSYLGMVESLGNWTANILIMLLIAVGKDFHIESIQTPRIRHVYSLNDLEKAYVPLTIKLNFLREYGIKTYPSIIDSKLRNSSYHPNLLKLKIRELQISLRNMETRQLLK